ncbi:MAG: hypothetical protein QNK19_06380 [Xanthomonadales bacterium]|nr:hypothetical protein [Xanthomonadales bacterium]
MGFFDFPAPLFDFIDGLLAITLPPVLRLAIWGALAGWLTMIVYQFFSDQERIGALKALQKEQQKNMAEFDGEFSELLPLIRHTLTLGFRQLGLALGPALLATVPVLFIVIWVAGEFGYVTPAAGSEVYLSIEPASSEIHWSSTEQVGVNDDGWVINWPSPGQSLTISEATMGEGYQSLLVLPMEHDIPIIHKKRWWNLLMANPLGYLPENGKTDVIHIDLREAVIIDSGPAWMRGWMFSFFLAFLLSSIGFKLLLRLD